MSRPLELVEVTWTINNLMPTYAIANPNMEVEKEDSLIAYLEIDEDDSKEWVKFLNLREEIVETIARNLVAWDTSKDKKQGLLPEVYLSNQRLYKQLTGEEYNFYKVCKKYRLDY